MSHGVPGGAAASCGGPQLLDQPSGPPVYGFYGLRMRAYRTLWPGAQMPRASNSMLLRW